MVDLCCDVKTCSCSYTSIIFSELLTSEPEPSPRCTCPPLPAYCGPLQTTTCLPQPLPATPRVVRRDYLTLEKTLISPADSKPFVPDEPQTIYFTKSYQKYVAEPFSCCYQQMIPLRRGIRRNADWIVPRDRLNTPFHSIVYLKSNKKRELNLLRKESEIEAVVKEEERKNLSFSKDSDVTTTNSIYKAMGSTGTSGDPSEATRMVSAWKKVFLSEGSELSSLEESLDWSNPPYDSGDETKFSDRIDYALWYSELAKLDRILISESPSNHPSTASSISDLSCATATSISYSLETSLIISPRKTLADNIRLGAAGLYQRARAFISK